MTPPGAERGLWGGKLLLFDTLPSTNQWVLDNIHSLHHGDVVRALRQTAGRGRFQRQWVTPGDRCLTFSVLLQYTRNDQWLAPVTGQAAALAVRLAIENHQIPAMLKWPNDVLIRGKKVAGILAERHADGGVVLGVGLNVNLPAAELAAIDLIHPATSMRIETGSDFDIDVLAADVFQSLEAAIDRARRRGMSGILDAWKPHDALAGKRISVQAAGLTATGTYAGLAPDGRLRLVDDEGREHLFWAGDASLR